MDVLRYPSQTFWLVPFFYKKKMMMDSLLLTILEIINLVLKHYLFRKEMRIFKNCTWKFLNKNQY